MPRKALGKVQSHWRVKPETVEDLDLLAQALGYKYGGKGAVGEMLDAIAEGRLLIVQKNISKKP